MVPMVILDLVLSPDFLGLQNPLSSVSDKDSSDEDDHLDSSLGGLEYDRGVPIAIIFNVFITLSSALSTPLSLPRALKTLGEEDIGVV